MMNSKQRHQNIDDRLGDKRAQVLALAARYGATDLRVFGSVARGEAGPDSDIDILVKPNPDWSLLDRIQFKQALETLLGCPVDLITDPTLHPRLRERVLQEAVPL
jgi:predicted nucleotidyltransferase